MVRGREAWRAAVHDMTEQLNHNMLMSLRSTLVSKCLLATLLGCLLGSGGLFAKVGSDS